MERPGVFHHEGNCTFTIWAPQHEQLFLHLTAPEEKMLPMEQQPEGYFSLTLPAKEGYRYKYSLGDQGEYPDPASCYQPEGVHGPSAVIDHSTYQWQDSEWRSLPFNNLILYELHTGTFTPEGTFEAIIPRLNDLLQLGINAIELMPVTQFPGTRNWGYDTAYPYAVQNSYGGPEGLKRLVDACHQKGIAVFLDVIYNHLGPEGNYLSQFGPYFSDKYKTPWGSALNFDGEWSDEVRHYFVQNMRYWFTHYHIDGLRLDAIHEVYDRGAVHFWKLLHDGRDKLVQELGRPLYLVAESDLNSPHVVQHPQIGGWGFDAQWLDDFHHSLYVLLDKPGQKHYIDFGELSQLAKAYKEGFVHSGDYVQFRKRRHGASSAGIPGNHFISFIQNHDLVGNRPNGDRLSMLVDTPRLKLAAAAVLLSPYIPMLFMGEEYAADTPFLFFASYGDENIIAALREGRKKEFEAFEWGMQPPDAMDENTFRQSILQWEQRQQGHHNGMLTWYTQLIAYRRSQPLLQLFDKNNIRVNVVNDKLLLQRQNDTGTEQLLCCFNFSDVPSHYPLPEELPQWRLALDENGPVEGHKELAAGQLHRLAPWGIAVFESVQAG